MVTYCGGAYHITACIYNSCFAGIGDYKYCNYWLQIGGGDGFVGGMLYSVLRGFEPSKWPQFAWATGALAATLETDYAQPINEEQVWSIFEGNARVKR